MHTPKPATLVLAFNRPERLRQTLTNLRASAPSRVYVNIDGPRQGNEKDALAIEQCANLVRQQFSDLNAVLNINIANQGLGEGARKAISWFFEEEACGMVLEDDVHIAPKSLELAGQLLQRYHAADQVGSISLFSAVPRRFLKEPDATFRLSAFPPSWFWGTWRDRWQNLQTNFESWRDLFSERELEQVGGKRFAHVFARECDAEAEVPDVNWEGAWIRTHLANEWKCLVTNATYCVHTGYDESATHLTEQPSWQPTTFREWSGGVREPNDWSIDRRADRWTLNQRFALSWSKRCKASLGRRLPTVRRVWRSMTIKPIGETYTDPRNP